MDDVDYARVIQRNWYVQSKENGRKFYAVYTPGRTTVRMHRFILGLSNGDGSIVDHIDGNGLNNQRHNLRLVSNSQNCANNKRPLPASGFRGVSWRTSTRKWHARIIHNSQHIHLGFFENAQLAAEAWNKAASELRGEFAILNEFYDQN